MSLFVVPKKMPSLFACMVIAFIAMISFPADAFGQSRSRSGGGSSYRSTPKPKPSANNQSRQNRDARANRNNNRSWGNSNRNSNRNSARSNQTRADRALHDRAKKQGTHFQSRQQATSAFKKNKGAEISRKFPTKFDSKPATRPDYIPQSTSVGGKTYNITYNQQYGGYGYMDALGTFIIYDMLTDAAFMNTQMRSYGYAYGPAPSGGIGAGVVIGVVVGVVVIGGIVFFVVMRDSSDNRMAA
jgi:hypothetical protein